MSTWRRKALEILPEQKVMIESSQSPGELWCDLSALFFEYAKNDENELIKKIIRYASWCTSPEAGDESGETHQAVYCGFLEDITRYHNYFPNFKAWFRPSEFEKFKGSFMYALSEKDYKYLEDLFYGR
jgi:hypothetical protein